METSFSAAANLPRTKSHLPQTQTLGLSRCQPQPVIVNIRSSNNEPSRCILTRPLPGEYVPLAVRILLPVILTTTKPADLDVAEWLDSLARREVLALSPVYLSISGLSILVFRKIELRIVGSKMS